MSQISCMGFNILSCDTHDCGYELPADRYAHVLRTIKENPTDLVGIQEACDTSCKDAVNKRCKGFGWVDPLLKDMEALGYTGVPIRDQKGFELEKQTIACGLIIFYKSDRFEMLDGGAYNYRHDRGRYYQWVKLHDKEYDRDILFTNTHFSIDPRVADRPNGMAGDAFRTVQSVKLLNFWYENCDEKTALFATGDYNSTPTSNAQNILRSKQFKPSGIVARVIDEHGTVNFARGACIIDYCYVNPAAQDVLEYRAVRDHYESDKDARLAGYASDHRAILTFCDYK